VLKVTKPHVLAVLVGSLLAICLLGATAVAQPQGSAPPPSGSRFGAEIALVDIEFLFKNHPRFKQYVTDWQADLERADGLLKNERDLIKKLQDRLNDYRPGTQEYKDMEEQVVTKQADLSARVTLQRKDFLKQEAKIHYSIYQQIQEEVDAFASANGVLAVLVFDRERMDPEKPETIQKGLRNQVLWYHKNLDISLYILDNLKRRAGPAQTGNAPSYGFPKSSGAPR
jgi:Skp family chaperone for outer membrane proteins